MVGELVETYQQPEKPPKGLKGQGVLLMTIHARGGFGEPRT
jgi:hypothetical protein